MNENRMHENWMKASLIMPLKGDAPKIPASTFIAPGVVIAGDIEVGEDCSFWYHVVARADVGSVRIGNRVNVQDHSMLHMTGGKSHVVIGDDVTIGHRAIVHGATIGNRVLIGMGAIILDNAVIPDDCIVGAGALVTGGMTFEPGSLILGSPAKAVRKIDDRAKDALITGAAHYVKMANLHREAIAALPTAGEE